ncbi:hypothetical protein ACHAWF_000898 [Thalassiosira exigua]
MRKPDARTERFDLRRLDRSRSRRSTSVSRVLRRSAGKLDPSSPSTNDQASTMTTPRLPNIKTSNVERPPDFAWGVHRYLHAISPRALRLPTPISAPAMMRSIAHRGRRSPGLLGGSVPTDGQDIPQLLSDIPEEHSVIVTRLFQSEDRCSSPDTISMWL